MMFCHCMQALSYKGSFSFREDNVNWVRLDDQRRIRIERISNDVARVYLVDEAGNQLPMPGDLTMADETGGQVAVVADAFFIAWVGSYSIRRGGVTVMDLTQQKQHSIKALAAMEHGVDVVEEGRHVSEAGIM